MFGPSDSISADLRVFSRRRFVVYAAVFAYSLWFRADGIAGHFQLLGDQIRDWTFALGPASDLPLAGPPSMAGGRTLGPIYYWLIWLSRVLIGPFADNLPHAGGIGLCLLQGGADLLLLRALLARFESGALAVAVVLLVATSPFESAVTATVWNPQVAVAFSKAAIALLLLGARTDSRGVLIATAAVAWMAIQGHSSALVVAAPVLTWVVLRHLAGGRFGTAARSLGTTALVILVLQIPFALQFLLYGSERAAGPTRALGVWANLRLDGLLEALVGSALTASRFVGTTLFDPWWGPWWGGLFVAAGLVVVAATRLTNAEWLFVTVLPIASAVVLYLPVSDRRDYWYLVLTAPAAVLLGRALSLVRLPAGRHRWIAGGALALVLVAQPSRFAYSREVGRFPQYGFMVKASRLLVREGVRPRAITTAFPIDTSEPEFVFRVLGGQLDPQSAVEARILPGGGVLYVEAGK